MTVNRYGHVDIRVNNLKIGSAFYGKFLPAMGFTGNRSDDEWRVFASEGPLPSAPFFSITEDKSHQPNGNRVAFWADDREAVNRAAKIALAAGARIESGPRHIEEYSATYYAVFFADPFGNLLEVYHRTD